MSLPFWKKDNRRADEELLNEPFSLRLSKKEIDFVREQSKLECTSSNSLIRKAISQYKIKVKKELD